MAVSLDVKSTDGSANLHALFFESWLRPSRLSYNHLEQVASMSTPNHPRIRLSTTQGCQLQMCPALLVQEKQTFST